MKRKLIVAMIIILSITFTLINVNAIEKDVAATKSSSIVYKGPSSSSGRAGSVGKCEGIFVIESGTTYSKIEYYITGTSTIRTGYIPTSKIVDLPDDYFINVQINNEHLLEIFSPKGGVKVNEDSNELDPSVTENAKRLAQMVFKDTELKNHRYLYYLYGEWALAPDPDGKIGNVGGTHEGIDVRDRSNVNAKVYSIAEGKVVGYNKEKGHIAIYDEDKEITVIYYHCNSIDSKVIEAYNDQNKKILQGQLVGTQGKKGGANGEHVHVQIQEGNCGKTVYSGRDTEVKSLSPYSYISEYYSTYNFN